MAAAFLRPKTTRVCAKEPIACDCSSLGMSAAPRTSPVLFLPELQLQLLALPQLSRWFCLFTRGLCVPVAQQAKSSWFFSTAMSSASSCSQSGTHNGGNALVLGGRRGSSSHLPLRLPPRSSYSSKELRRGPMESSGLSGHTDHSSRLLEGQDQDPQSAGGLA